MFTRIVTSALFAGFAAGLIAAALQLLLVQPVLLHAELYESGALVHFGSNAVAASADVAFAGFNLARDGLSILFTALVYVGYGLMLVAAMALASDRGAVITARNGLLWGIAGFVAVQAAPALGLPPEVPGSSAGDLVARQIWWFATVGSAAVAMWLFAFSKGWPLWVAGVALLVVPHIIGAPQPDSFAGLAPPELSGLFASRALGVGLVAWATLGLLAGHFWQTGNK